MKGFGGRIVIFIMVIILGGAGAAVLVSRISADNSKAASYNNYVASAREKAAKGINYYAKQDYLRALTLDKENIALFKEFFAFLDATDDGSYEGYLKQYMKKFPKDAEPYEILCQRYYDNENYTSVLLMIQNAKENGTYTEKVAEYEKKTLYSFTSLSGGYEDISLFHENQAVIQKKGAKGLYYYDNGVIVEPEYESMTYFINSVIAVKKDGECYYADLLGNKSQVLDKPVDSLSMFANGHAAVSVDGKYGYIAKDLKVPAELPYDFATPFSGNVAGVVVGGKWGIVNTNLEYVVSPKYDDILLSEYGTILSSGVIFAKEAGGYVMLNAAGEKIADHTFQDARVFGSGGQPAAVKLNDKWTFVKTSGELFDAKTEVAEAGSFQNNLAPVTLDGELWGYMDGYGEIVIEPQFEECKQFCAYGIAPVREGNTWKMIQLLRYKN